MGGGKKARRQDTAEKTSTQATQLEQQRAQDLHNQLEQQRSRVGAGLGDIEEATRGGAMELQPTGGYTIQPLDLTGRGYEGYQKFAETGGFSQEDKDKFMRQSMEPVNAVYSNVSDQLQRQKALQGGYMPGFTASQGRLERGAAQQGSEAALSASTNLAQQIRSGQLAGLAGEERVRATAGEESARQAEAIQRGRLAAQDLLQRYSQFGESALSDVDINEMRNRLQSGQLTMEDAQLITQIAAQNRTLFENIMQGITTVGGAAAGVMTGVGSLGGTKPGR